MKQDDIFTRARKSEREYHDGLYHSATLFTPGTWLAKPVKLVIDSFRHQLDHSHSDVSVLDLGCGVGRNSIPIAKMIEKDRTGMVTCVDLLESAISRLDGYSRQYKVEGSILPIQSSVEDFRIEKDKFDFIVSVSCIEHVMDEATFESILKKIIWGTNTNGSNCLMICANVRWIDKINNSEIEPLIELNLDTNKTVNLLKELYKDWNIRQLFVKQWESDMNQGEREVVFQTDCLCLVSRKK